MDTVHPKAAEFASNVIYWLLEDSRQESIDRSASGWSDERDWDHVGTFGISFELHEDEHSAKLIRDLEAFYSRHYVLLDSLAESTGHGEALDLDAKVYLSLISSGAGLDDLDEDIHQLLIDEVGSIEVDITPDGIAYVI